MLDGKLYGFYRGESELNKEQMKYLQEDQGIDETINISGVTSVCESSESPAAKFKPFVYFYYGYKIKKITMLDGKNKVYMCTSLIEQRKWIIGIKICMGLAQFKA